MNLQIRHVQAAMEWQIFRALLPEACARPAGITEGLLALQVETPKVAGAAVVHFDGADAWFHLHVVRTLRCRGAGTRLLHVAIGAAAQRDVHRIIAVCDTLAEPAAEPFLSANGFAPVSRFTNFEAELAALAPLVQATARRLAASNRVPPTARIVLLPDAPRREVAQLYAAYIAGRADLSRAPIDLNGDLESWKRSPVLLVDGKVAGAILGGADGEVATVSARIVASPFQGGGAWANALLLNAAIDQAFEVNARRIRFESRDNNSDTMKLARRTGASILSVRTRFERVLSMRTPGPSTGTNR